MQQKRIASLTALAMIAFAGNSLLCRVALVHTGIDAASFTSVRLVSGALVLWLIVSFFSFKRGQAGPAGSWTSAFALFAYAACFSFAYVSLSAATGALLLFGAVQTTMIGFGLWKGERLRGQQVAGLMLAVAGLLGLLLPGLSAPPPAAAALMLSAGVAWGVYSLRAKGAADPTRITAGNFVRAVPFAILLSAVMFARHSGNAADARGIGLAIASGALASGVGYAVWYTALRGLNATTAATVQLSVPVIAAFGGIAFLGEAITLRLLFTSIAILGGIALITLAPRPAKAQA
ncbi:MAG: EamA family transporter [Massilia sp.]|nr:EamA family transporter [Massilia sp.]MDB5951167.1 EamA family transporter [Massilia sp.]